MAVAITNLKFHSAGDQASRTATITGDASYPNPAGYLLNASDFGLNFFTSIQLGEVGGYTIAAPDLSVPLTSTHLHYFEGASGTTGGTTITGTNGTSNVPAQVFNGTPATVPAQVFTGAASPLNVAVPSFSGTGLTAAGQVLTTTDNQTMTLNQCAGMWLIYTGSGAKPPVMILSNTAVVGAPAVLTVQGVATTDAGTYKIVTTIPVGTNGTSAFTPAGTNASATAAAQVWTASGAHTHTVGAAAGGEVPNATNLSAVSFEITIYGY